MKFIDCTCGGFNENCYKCGGKGFYEEEPYIPNYKNITINKKESILSKKCNFCSKIIQKEHFDKHYIKCTRENQHILHINSALAKSNKGNNYTSTSNTPILRFHFKENNDIEKQLNTSEDTLFIKCDFCLKMIQEKYFVHHYVDCTREHVSIAKEQKKKVKTFSKKCDFCSKMIQEGHFDKHYAKCKRKNQHISNINAAVAKSNKGNNSIPTSNKSEMRCNFKENNDIEKRLDATYDFSFLYRENGRYGSSPSYDDYSEESEP